MFNYIPSTRLINELRAFHRAIEKSTIKKDRFNDIYIITTDRNYEDFVPSYERAFRMPREKFPYKTSLLRGSLKTINKYWKSKKEALEGHEKMKAKYGKKDNVFITI